MIKKKTKLQIWKLIKPKFHNMVTWLIVSSGLILISPSLFSILLNELLEKHTNYKILGEHDILIGLVLVIIGVAYNLRSQWIAKYEPERNTIKNSTITDSILNQRDGVVTVNNFLNVNRVIDISSEIVTDIIANPVENKKYINSEPKLWSKINLGLRLAVRTDLEGNGKQAIIGIIYYSGDRLYTSESDIAQWMRDAIKFEGKPIHHRMLHHSFILPALTATNFVSNDWTNVQLSINHTPWKAAVYLLIEKNPPKWYQLEIRYDKPKMTPKPGSGVSVRSFALNHTDNPSVASGNEKLF